VQTCITMGGELI